MTVCDLRVKVEDEDRLKVEEEGIAKEKRVKVKIGRDEIEV